MAASDFEAVLLHNLGAIGRMVPVSVEGNVVNVGATWQLDGYTVPAGRVLALDVALMFCYSGTLPSTSEITIRNAAGSRVGYLAREGNPVLNRPLHAASTPWLISGQRVRFRNTGGGATTDMGWSVLGRLFDWSDFTSG